MKSKEATPAALINDCLTIFKGLLVHFSRQLPLTVEKEKEVKGSLEDTSFDHISVFTLCGIVSNVEVLAVLLDQSSDNY